MTDASDAEMLALLQRRASEAAAGHLGHAILEIDRAAGRARAAFETREGFLNPLGSVQGGFLVAMLDEVMVDAALARLGADFAVPTLEIKASFLAPAGAGRIIGEARVLRMGRSIAFIEGELYDEAGAHLVSGSCTVALRAMPGAAGRTRAPGAGGTEPS